MAAATVLSRRLGSRIRDLGLKRGPESWHSPHMAAAARAILERVPLVDLVVEVRDARIPCTSTCELLEKVSYSHKHMIVLNKMDLADRSLTEKWVKHFEKQKCICYANNSHKKDDIKELLKTVRARIKELKSGEFSYTATVLLVGIPNVGKSALANSMHQIGRIGAAEKGKLKHAVVSPQPGETKGISSYKIASHPNIYVLDTPGVLSPEIADDDSGSKLALTGAVKDSLAGEYELAQYFLYLLNSEDVYKRWENLKDEVDETLSLDNKGKLLATSGSGQRTNRQYTSDHTQDFIVRDVRRTLFKTRSSFNWNLEQGNEMEGLIKAQFTALYETFRVSHELDCASVEILARPIRKNEEAHEKADATANGDGVKTLASYMHNILDAEARHRYQIEGVERELGA